MKKILLAFQYAFKGILYCLRFERNFRIHITAAFYITLFSLLYRLSAVEYALLICVFGLVLFAETVNTAFEVLVDMSAPAYNHMAKLAKDIAAGAVLIISLFSVVVGIGLFRDFGRVWGVALTVALNPLYLILFIVSAALSVLFIMGKLTGGRKK